MIPIANLANFLVPCIVVLIVGWGLLRRQNVFDLFLSGAKEGIGTALGVLPALIALMTAIAMFRASGAMDWIVHAATPLAAKLHFPAEVLPLALMRPVSGSGSLSVLEQLLKTYGPDSAVGRIASVLQGSTETTFYTIAVYFGAVGVTRTRHTVPAALLAEFCGFVMSIVAVRIFFG